MGRACCGGVRAGEHGHMLTDKNQSPACHPILFGCKQRQICVLLLPALGVDVAACRVLFSGSCTWLVRGAPDLPRLTLSTWQISLFETDSYTAMLDPCRCTTSAHVVYPACRPLAWLTRQKRPAVADVWEGAASVQHAAPVACPARAALVAPGERAAGEGSLSALQADVARPCLGGFPSAGYCFELDEHPTRSAMHVLIPCR